MKNQLFATIILSENYQGSDQRGESLVNFLKVFLPKNNLRVINASEIDELKRVSCRYCFLFFPTPLKPETLRVIRYEHLVLCEFSDQAEIKYSEMLAFKNETETVLKPCIYSKLSYPFKRMKCLPIQLKPSPYFFIRAITQKKIDCNFIGNTTTFKGMHQRVDWVLEMHKQSSVSFFGGVLDTTHHPLHRLEDYNTDDIKNITFNKTLSRFWFLKKLAESKVALCPSGYIRWTYRHYESILCKCAVASTEIEGYSLLIPLPIENFMIIKDHEPILEKIKNMCDNWEIWQKKIEKSYNFINKFLVNGNYSKKKPLIFDRFMDQLPR